MTGQRRGLMALTLVIFLTWTLPGTALIRPAPLWAAATEPARGAQYQDLSSEFPNLFLGDKYRSLSPDQIPGEEIIRARRALESALGSVLDRLTIPIVKPGDSRPSLVRYFPYLQEHLRSIDPDIRVMPSAGVVRSAIGYLYQQMLEGWRSSPRKSPEEILQAIARSRQDLASIDVRGIGSDVDVWLVTRKLKEARSLALDITNSALRGYGERSGRDTLSSGIKKTLFAIGDVKDYEEQVTRSTRQGGATIDFLAYDFTKRALIEPAAVPGIVDDLIRGRYSYLAPAEEKFTEDAAKQLIRGPRALLEIPFLKIRDEARIRREIGELRSKLEKGESISEKAIEQFSKMTRNSRWGGAHNRFYRAPEGSLESEFLHAANLLRKRIGHPPIPEFADSVPLDGRQEQSSGVSPVPPGLLMGRDEFFSKFTRGGSLYHGTPHPESALALLRQGIHLSTNQQGTAAYGRGAYASPEPSVAQSYAQSRGVVLELKIRDHPGLRVLDWRRHEDDPFIRAVKAEADSLHMDVFELLARKYGIDLIVNEHVLIQNSEAIEFPDKAVTVRRLIEQHLRNISSKNLWESTRAFEGYNDLAQYAPALGIADLPDAKPAYYRALIAILSQPNRLAESQRLTVRALADLGHPVAPSDVTLLRREATRVLKSLTLSFHEKLHSNPSDYERYETDLPRLVSDYRSIHSFGVSLGLTSFESPEEVEKAHVRKLREFVADGRIHPQHRLSRALDLIRLGALKESPGFKEDLHALFVQYYSQPELPVSSRSFEGSARERERRHYELSSLIKEIRAEADLSKPAPRDTLILIATRNFDLAMELIQEVQAGRAPEDFRQQLLRSVLLGPAWHVVRQSVLAHLLKAGPADSWTVTLLSSALAGNQDLDSYERLHISQVLLSSGITSSKLLDLIGEPRAREDALLSLLAKDDPGARRLLVERLRTATIPVPEKDDWRRTILGRDPASALIDSIMKAGIQDPEVDALIGRIARKSFLPAAITALASRGAARTEIAQLCHQASRRWPGALPRDFIAFAANHAPHAALRYLIRGIRDIESKARRFNHFPHPPELIAHFREIESLGFAASDVIAELGALTRNPRRLTYLTLEETIRYISLKAPPGNLTALEILRHISNETQGKGREIAQVSEKARAAYVKLSPTGRSPAPSLGACLRSWVGRLVAPTNRNSGGVGSDPPAD